MNEVPRTDFPLYWRDEQTGEMAEAVQGYLNHLRDKTELCPRHLELMIDYCQAWAECPAFRVSRRFMNQATNMKTSDDLHRWLHLALEEGIDPL